MGGFLAWPFEPWQRRPVLSARHRLGAILTTGALLLLLPACGPSGTLEACAGSYSGPYTGGEEGLITATLTLDGVFAASFVPAEGDSMRDVEGTVTASGAVSASDDLDMTGTMNFDECTASGMWTGSSDDGTWELSKY